MDGGARWSIRDGKSTSFWNTGWLDNSDFLADHVINDQFLGDASVVDMVSSEGEWDLDRIAPYLPREFVLHVAGVPVPREDLGDDELVWGLELED
ncbi:unnamed protein product [Linum trigynum]|uniref:Uncharacterized protein n=1 Tax=Linum trigynum TaxID=586398 RepID=A0AAV2ES80_9ROSI